MSNCKTFITFGYDHVHRIDNQVFDRDCVAIINGPSYAENREKAFELFGSKFCFEYPETHWKEDQLKHFPRGCIEVELEDESRGTPLSEVTDVKQLQLICEQLWQALDEIDTAEDICRANDNCFRTVARVQINKRWKLLTSDGYKLYLPKEEQ